MVTSKEIELYLMLFKSFLWLIFNYLKVIYLCKAEMSCFLE